MKNKLAKQNSHKQLKTPHLKKTTKSEKLTTAKEAEARERERQGREGLGQKECMAEDDEDDGNRRDKDAIDCQKLAFVFECQLPMRLSLSLSLPPFFSVQTAELGVGRVEMFAFCNL